MIRVYSNRGFPVLSLTMMVLLVIGGLLILSLLGWGVVLLLIQLGVIANEATRPPHTDAGEYRLEQGRDVGQEERRA